jgi:hypothetical protein
MGNVIQHIAFSACTPCRFSPSVVQRFDDFPNFPRNGPPDSTQYISEAPEMTSSKQAVKEGHNQKRKLNNE